MSPAEIQEALRAIRAEIDIHDAALIQVIQAAVMLLQRRAKCAEAAGGIKRDHRLPIRDPRREAEVLEHVRRAVGIGGPLSAEEMTLIFERIIAASCKVQQSEILT